MPHSAETVSDLTRAQYAASHQTARLIQVITAVVCLLIGIRVIGHVAEPFNYFFSLYGCLAIVFINVPAKSTADRTVKQIQASGKAFPCSVFVFGERASTFAPRATAERAKTSPMPNAIGCFVIVMRPIFFLNEQAAFIFPDHCIKGQSPDAFQAFLSLRTGKPCRTLYPWLTASLRSIIKEKKAGWIHNTFFQYKDRFC